MHVIDYSFNDIPDAANWAPADLYDFAEWIMVTVGNTNGGSDFQLHVCTPIPIRQIRDKRGCFMIDRWEGVDNLLERINAFIAEQTSDAIVPVEEILARYWLWEYENYRA